MLQKLCQRLLSVVACTFGLLAQELSPAQFDASVSKPSVESRVMADDHYLNTDARLKLSEIEHYSQLSSDDRERLDQATRLYEKAHKLFSERQFADAERAVREALATREKYLGQLNSEVISSLRNLAYILQAQEKIDEWVSVLREVSTRRLKALGAEHPESIESRSELCVGMATLVERKQNAKAYDAAQQLNDELIDLSVAYFGENDYRTKDARWSTEHIRRLAGFSPEQHRQLVLVSDLRTQVSEAYDAGRLEEGIELARKALGTIESLFGHDNRDYVACLNDLASLYRKIGDFARVERLYLQKIQIVQQALGKQHPYFATSLNDLALLCDDMGDYARAERLFTEAAQIRKSVLGEQHPLYAISLNNLAALHHSLGDYARAEQLYAQAIPIQKRVLGEHNPDYATSLNNLGRLVEDMGDYAQAETLYTQAAQIRKVALGEQHPHYATSLNNLAALHHRRGDYARAEPLYVQAMPILKHALGEHDPTYTTCLNNLAELYRGIGDYPRAEPLFLQALLLRKEALGEQHPGYAASLSGLALLYERIGDYARAEQLSMQALDICKQVLGEQHPEYANYLNNLAGLFQRMGDYTRAEPLVSQAMQISKAVLGEQHPDYARGLNNLAGVYESMGDRTRAEPLFIQAQQILQQVLGEQHPYYASSLDNLAQLYADTERVDQAVRLFEQVLVITRKSLDDTAYALSERQQLAMNQRLRYRLDDYLRACLAASSIPAQAVENVMLWKGSVLFRQRGLRIAADDPLISEQFVELQQVVAQLSRLAQAVPAPDQAASWKARLAELTGEKEVLEAQLMRSSAAFRQAVQPISFDQIQQSIPKDGVLVDYLEFFGNEGRSLLASIVKPDAAPTMIYLGSATEASAAIDVWRETYGMSPRAKTAGLELRKQIWEPVLAHLGAANTILVSTDGLLGRLPLAALPGKEPGSYLIEDHRLALIPVPQLLPALVNEQGRRELQHELLLMGDVDYDATEDREAPQSTEPRKRPWERSVLPHAVRGEVHWNALAETRAEVEFIAGLYKRLYQPGPEAVLDLRQAAASESAFRALAPESVFLHLATHGFFAAPEQKSALSTELIAQREEDRASRFEQHREAIRGYSPGQLSGIVFAGANHKPVGVNDALGNQDQTDDGIMTADEIAFMRLEGVRLVVLSACETGLGEVAGGEGLLGIQRGFQLAGARSTVASLWKVNDAATRRMMQEFYTNYLDQEMSMLDALRETQLWALKHPGDVPRGAIRDSAEDEHIRLPPEYWAPFVLSGDWR